MLLDDTIAAISSAVGTAARMIVRVSGVGASGILSRFLETSDHRNHPNPSPLLFEHEPQSRRPGYRARGQAAFRATVHFSGLSIPAWIYSFVGPRSYTGDDLVEFHIPGNPLLAKMLLQQCISLGARLAEPGEFTARAYFNGRIDLSQAEGVAAAIEATSAEHLTAAQRLLAGELARKVRPLMESLANTLALVEVGIDFSEEDVEFLSADQVCQKIHAISEGLDDLLKGSARFEKLSHEPSVVLVGRPNAGKSTLLNALAQSERAVVSPTAGTTRDVLSATVALRRGTIRLLDAAGLGDGIPSDGIEIQMRDRAMHAIETADIVVRVIDISDQRPPLELNRQPDMVVLTKADLRPAHSGSALAVSAATGANMIRLRAALDAAAFGSEAVGSALALNARHIRAITEAQTSLSRARRSVDEAAAELVSADLRDALDYLGQILGTVSPDEILGRIFSTFCIGK